MQEIKPGIFVSTAFRRVNVGAILTDDGWVLIDTPPYPHDARRWRAQLAHRDPSPIRYVINTDHHRDRILNNAVYGGHVVAHRHTADAIKALPGPFIDQAIEALARNETERTSFAGTKLVLPAVSFTKRLFIKQGGRVIPVVNMPGPTPGSAWVHLPEHKIVFTGDSVVVDVHPDLSHADSKSWLDSLTMLRRKRFVADIVVPGRGPVTDKDATNPVSDYVRLARRKVLNLYREGRPRADMASLVSDFADLLPFDEPFEDIQRRIKSGLEHIYEEYKLADAARSENAQK